MILRIALHKVKRVRKEPLFKTKAACQRDGWWSVQSLAGLGSMKQLGVLLLPPGLDVSPSRG